MSLLFFPVFFRFFFALSCLVCKYIIIYLFIICAHVCDEKVTYRRHHRIGRRDLSVSKKKTITKWLKASNTSHFFFCVFLFLEFVLKLKEGRLSSRLSFSLDACAPFLFIFFFFSRLLLLRVFIIIITFCVIKVLLYYELFLCFIKVNIILWIYYY